MMRIGLIVNPVAGMGGAVGLKGTDGNVEQALIRGAVPHALERARLTLSRLSGEKGLHFATGSGSMGADILQETGFKEFEILYSFSGNSSALDTKAAARRFKEAGVDLILFCGGDGTARDIFEITSRDVPLLGIPGGVKMYSAVFAVDPVIAAELVVTFDQRNLRDSKILDIDESAYRAGKVQVAKQEYEEPDEERAKQEIARFIQEVVLPGTAYIIGAGTTTEAVAHRFGVQKTLLGVDIIKDGTLVASDVDEKTLLDLVGMEKEIRIIISPIGAQGFLLGRGNQQISAQVVRKVGLKNIIIVATPHKLAEIPALYVDSGDTDLDAEFRDSIQVISGYRIAQRKKIQQCQISTGCQPTDFFLQKME